ncbi:MAG TPA: hypothetical protein DDZ81_11100 [Acetobacteraceae bacterium]|jgi:hypothetical protein|nr:hypothetical protein [Acetobacteraceae bacterium]
MSGNLPAHDATINEAVLSALSDPATAARFLSAIAEQTGAAVFRSAAGMLRRGNVGGRPRHDDAAAITRMATMLTDGTANSPEQAARFVARTLIGEVSTDAAAARLARKYRSADKT